VFTRDGRVVVVRSQGKHGGGVMTSTSLPPPPPPSVAFAGFDKGREARLQERHQLKRRHEREAQVAAKIIYIHRTLDTRVYA
jgi:hypothetical protein